MLKRIEQKGIGLLELMLSLAIIAALLLAVIVYYQTTRTSEQVNSTVYLLEGIIDASEDWATSNGDFSGITPQKLVQTGKLPDIFCPDPNNCKTNSASPWGGSIDISSVASKVTITVNGIPQAKPGICQQLIDLMKGRGTGGCSGTTFILDYPH